MAKRPFESRLQDLVYNVEMGIGLRLIKLLLYVLFVLLLMLLYATNFKGLRTAEAMDYAQLGRNFAEHNRLITKCIRPVSLWYMIERSPHAHPMINQHPDILHPPMYPLALAAGFKAMNPSFVVTPSDAKFKPEQFVVMPLGLILAMLTGLFVYLMGRRLFDPNVALLGTTVYFLSDSVWANAISGGTVTLAVFFGILSLYLMILAVSNNEDNEGVRSWLMPFLLGALFLSFAFLTRYSMAILLPGVMLYVGFGFKRKGGLWAILVALVFLLCISPWMARNVTVCGSPFGLAPYRIFQDIGAFSGDRFDRVLAPEFVGEGFSEGLKIKFLRGLSTNFQEALMGGNGLLYCLFVVTFLYSFVRPPVRLFRWGVAFSILALWLTSGLYGNEVMDSMQVFRPIAILYGSAFFFLMLDRLQLPLKIATMAITGVIVFFSALPLIFTLMPPRASSPYPPYFPPFINHVSSMLREDELLCSDMPWANAWYSNQNSLLLPNSLDEFYDINDYTKRVSGLYFTTLTRNRPFVSDLATGSHRSWFPILQGRIPSDFPLLHGFPLNNMDQLFLTDRRRWEEQ